MMLYRLVFVILLCLLTACQLAPTPELTATRRPPRNTVTPIPTDTPEPTPTIAVRPTPTPIPLAEFCPLTGLRDANKPWLKRRPLVVKIDNAPLARPQSGLLSADIIIEHLAEGGVTRFDAIFWCGEGDAIGPIRSARLIDLEVVPMLQAILVNVGASNEVLKLLYDSFGKQIIDEGFDKSAFHRITTRAAPHNTYTSSAILWAVATERGINQKDLQLKGLTFNATAPSNGKAANTITIPYSPDYADTMWEYAAETKTYRKSLLGQPLMDAMNQQAQATNVVILFAPHSVTDIIEDSVGSRSIKIELTGRGRALIFRDGQMIAGTWLRTERNAMLRLVDANNQDVALKPGRSWFEVVPMEMNVEWR
jgi:hypothetical protein